MTIGIDASRAFLENRTGIEEYAYQVIRHLRTELSDERVVLYLRRGQKVDFDIPSAWTARIISWPRFWTQCGLALEMFRRPVDALFVPAHTVPWIHPARSIVTVHGLEYEVFPEAYSWWERLYMRWSIKFSCKWASKIIAVSENTKQDLVRLYRVPEEKIEVVYEGIGNFEFRISNFESRPNSRIHELPARSCYSVAGGPARSCYSVARPDDSVGRAGGEIHSKFKIQNSKFLLFVGRIETRKNIQGIIEAFEILKTKYGIPHALVLAGKPGMGYARTKGKVSRIKGGEDVVELGYVSEEEKWELLKHTDVFLFPTLYEGFGLPVLEAQAVGTPVVTSNTSSLPEISLLSPPAKGECRVTEARGLQSALLVDPLNPEAIAEATYTLISDTKKREQIIALGRENVKRFSWEKCARKIARILYKTE